MKAIATRKASTSDAYSSRPSFSKNGQGSFFPSFRESDRPFFGPVTIQPKLAIGQPGDKYEQEADAVAEKVIQHKCNNGSQEGKFHKTEEEDITISKKSIFESDDRINRNLIQENGINEVAPTIETQLQNAKGGGQPIDKRTRQNMEQSIGADFTNVKVHTGSSAIQMNQSLGSQAFTNGNDIYFNKGKYNPNTKPGKKLLAHELTHVVQQSGGELSPEKAGRSFFEKPPIAMVQKQNLTPDASTMTDDQVRAEITRIEAELAGQTGSSETANDLESALDLLRREEAERSTLAPQLNAITARYTAMIRDARSAGMNVAAENLHHFLNGSGSTRTLSVSWLRGFSEIIDAEEVNQGRFEESLHDLAISMPSGTTRNFNDHWDRRLTGGITTELYYASGTSTITSTGAFTLTKSGNTVTISGTVSHHWRDPYDWHANLSAYIPGHGSISDADALLLQRYRQASPFQMESDWTQTVSGTIEVVSWLPDSVGLVWTGP